MLWIQKNFLPAISRTRFRQFLLSTFSIFTRSIQYTILGGIRLIERNVDAVLSFRKFLPVSAGLPLVPPDPERVSQIRPVKLRIQAVLPEISCLSLLVSHPWILFSFI